MNANGMELHVIACAVIHSFAFADIHCYIRLRTHIHSRLLFAVAGRKKMFFLRCSLIAFDSFADRLTSPTALTSPRFVSTQPRHGTHGTRKKCKRYWERPRLLRSAIDARQRRRYKKNLRLIIIAAVDTVDSTVIDSRDRCRAVPNIKLAINFVMPPVVSFA